MPKKTPINQEDIEAFYRAFSDAKPVPQEKIRLNKPQKKLPVLKSEKKSSSKLSLRDIDDLTPVQPEEFIKFQQIGVPDKTLRKLRKGQYNVEATLDLHGMTIDVARQSIEDFFLRCIQYEMRVVLIIHGKGYHGKEKDHSPILKNKVNQWLRELSIVLAFCSATPLHGSRGATYVLLKRNSKGDTFLG